MFKRIQAARRALHQKLWAYLRVLTFFLVVLSVLALAMAHRMKASADDVALSAGYQMMRYAESAHQDGPRTVMLNGQRFGFGSGTTRDSVSTVLDRFAERCANRGLNPAAIRLAEIETPSRIPPSSGVTPGLFERMRDYADRGYREATRAMDRRGRGYQMCFDVGERPLTMAELGARMQRFADNHRLSEFGNMRYVFAEPMAEGTHFIVLYTDGGMELDAMFPDHGDAPGVDADGVDRYPGSRRILSGWEQGFAPSLSIYTVRGASDVSTKAHFVRSLRAHGWSIPDVQLQQSTHGLSVDRDNHNLTISWGLDARQQMVITVLHAS